MNVGEEVYCDFEKVKILEIKNGKITSVGDEYFSMGSNDLSSRCVPITENSIYVSTRISSYFEIMRETKNTINLYTGDIKQKYCRLWLEALGEEVGSNAQEEILNRAWIFTISLIDEIKKINDTRVMGVRLFR